MAFLELNFHSDVLGTGASVNVILPQASKTQIGMGGGRGEVFPTLYLLHGLSDDHTTWCRRTSIERYAARYGVAVVMPFGGRSFYADMAQGPAYFTYITEELPAICTSFFNGMSREKEYTYIAGLSMGGYGALKAALTYPDRYAGAASFSGAMNVASLYERGVLLGRDGWDAVFARAEDIVEQGNDVHDLAEKRLHEGSVLPKIYLSCGTKDGFLATNRHMHDLLVAQSQAHAYREAEGAGHNWDFWDDEIQRALAYFFAE